MPHENSPLLTCGLSGLLSGLGQDGQDEPLDVDSSLGSPATSRARSLNTFFGVIVPTVLSMFSIVLFLRTGEEQVMGMVLMMVMQIMRMVVIIMIMILIRIFIFCSMLAFFDMFCSFFETLLRVCDWPRWVVPCTHHAGCGIFNYLHDDPVHLCHLHQWRYPGWWGLLYPCIALCQHMMSSS